MILSWKVINDRSNGRSAPRTMAVSMNFTPAAPGCACASSTIGNPANVSVPDEALTALREQFTHSESGAGRLVLVTGPAASGRTQLLTRFLPSAAESGALVLHATGAPDEQRLNAGIVDQLFTNSALPAAVADQVGAVLALLHQAPPDEHRLGSPVKAAPAVADSEICRILLGLTRTQPVVIGVDDLQFADESSVRILLRLQRRIRSSRLLILLSHQDAASAAERQLLGLFTRLPHDHVRLGPLSTRAVGQVASELLGEPVDDELTGRLRELSGGSPLLVNALLEDYQRSERDGRPVTGPAFVHAVSMFLQRREAPLHRVAAAIGMLGDELSREAVACLAGVTEDVAEDLTAVLAGAGLLAHGRFRHAVAATAAVDSLPPAARAQLHVRAAKLKLRQVAPAGEVAAHLVAAGQPAPAWAVDVLRRAADRAAQSDDTGFAVRCLELALSAAPEPAQRHAILDALARVVWRVNPSAAAAYLAELRHSASDPEAVGAEPFTLARHALWHGEADLFAKAVADLAKCPDRFDAPAAAKLTLAAQWHFGRCEVRVEQPADPAPRHSDPWRHTAATLIGMWMVGTSDATTASAEQILRNCPLADTTLESLVTAILALAHDNRSKRAEYWCAMLSQQAARRGAVAWQAMIDGVWSGIVLRRGDVTQGVTRARAALRLLDTQSWGVSISYPLTTLLVANTVAGAFDAAAAALHEPVPDTMFGTIGGLRYLRARGQFHLATDRVLAAISDFQRYRRLMARAKQDHLSLLPWRTDLAEAHLRLGHLAAARELAKQQLERCAETDTYGRGSALRILGMVAVQAERPILLGQATECFKRSGDLLELARKLKVPGQEFPQPADQTGPARVGAPQALRALSAPDTPSASGEPPESSVLTEAELRVAQLAALGQTNQQIGSRLFITVSTVEQHLTRVYRKMGIRGRSQLAEQLASSALEATG
ncbi:AAA family ATPase [Micromonospora sp. KC606]|uniref:LuxR C-terminal-related transcriptional regulator n=1 Tax=Micromonospora sp. KC606 TaxID=2530379 RepID=UPI00326733B8